jgi:hypothetical protein
MSCSVCTCTHHLAVHRAKEPMPCGIKGCDCEAFVLLDVIAWAARQPRKMER